METWKEFEANPLSHSAAHHLLAIHELGAAYGGWARVSDIARRLGITRGSVSINLRVLKKRALVLTDEHHLVRLSPAGEQIAATVIAKRGALRAFLSRVLGLSASQAEIDSCKIEHLISQPTSERLLHLARFLTADDPLMRAVLGRFQKSARACSPGKPCPICQPPVPRKKNSHAAPAPDVVARRA